MQLGAKGEHRPASFKHGKYLTNESVDVSAMMIMPTIRDSPPMVATQLHKLKCVIQGGRTTVGVMRLLRRHCFHPIHRPAVLKCAIDSEVELLEA
jgi:hypothetical protein